MKGDEPHDVRQFHVEDGRGGGGRWGTAEHSGRRRGTEGDDRGRRGTTDDGGGR